MQRRDLANEQVEKSRRIGWRIQVGANALDWFARSTGQPAERLTLAPAHTKRGACHIGSRPFTIIQLAKFIAIASYAPI